MTVMFPTESALVDAFLEGLEEARPWGIKEVVCEFFYLRGRTDVVTVISGGHVVAFEAKLEKWREALHQAYRNTCFAHWSFVVVPPAAARQAVRSLDEFRRRRVGLCTIASGEVVVLYEPPWASPLQPWLAARAMSAARGGDRAASA